MASDNPLNEIITISPMEFHRKRNIMLAFRDIWRGEWTKEYDSWDIGRQVEYEFGRLYALFVLAQGRDLLKLYPANSNTIPPEYERAYRKADAEGYIERHTLSQQREIREAMHLRMASVQTGFGLGLQLRRHRNVVTTSTS